MTPSGGSVGYWSAAASTAFLFPETENQSCYDLFSFYNLFIVNVLHLV